MPLPRYQPIKKRSRVDAGFSIDDLDDYCLAKIIGYALVNGNVELSTARCSDTEITERNLSLVSKRWYFLTQTQVATHGFSRINLDQIIRATSKKVEMRTIPRSVSHIAYAPLSKRPGVLTQKNLISTKSDSNMTATFKLQNTQANQSCDISLFRAIQPKLFKYKHLRIDGSLSCDEFRRLVIALDAARIEQLELGLNVEKISKPQVEVFSSMPKHLLYLEKLKLIWTNDKSSKQTNSLCWTLFERALHLRILEVYLEDSDPDSSGSTELRPFDNNFNAHFQLQKVVFIRSIPQTQSQIGIIQNLDDCSYTSLIRGVLMSEDSVLQVETNDSMLIDHLINSSSRICTTRRLESLKYPNPIRDMDMLRKLMQSSALGTRNLSVAIDNVELLDEVRSSIEEFGPARSYEHATCQLTIYLKDQKFPDFEAKIKSLTNLSRIARLIIHVNAQQRVSIECCHLMWSVGRALQSTVGAALTSNLTSNGYCLFKIALQPAAIGIKINSNNYTQITIPFGRCQNYNLDPQREDLYRHREIMKALKRDCYHTFVKSVREPV